jgi:hypothetical protein
MYILNNNHVFKQVIEVSGISKDTTKIVYFQWMLKDSISMWGDNFVNSHHDCTFDEFS